MKQIRTLLLYFSVLSVILITTGCASFSSSRRTWMDIQPGMTQQQILTMLGKPDYRRFNYDIEEWEYQKFNPIGNNTVIIIGFENKIVVNMNSFPVEPKVPPTPPQTNTPQVIPSYPNQPSYPVVQPGRPVYPMYPMNDQEFQQLLEQVKRASFSSDRLKVVQNAINNRNFTCKQTATLLALISFDDDKLKALTLIAPRITDGVNYEQVINTFSFSSNKDKARKILGKQ